MKQRNELRELYGKNIQHTLTEAERLHFLELEEDFYLTNARVYALGDYQQDTEEIGYVFPNMPQRVWPENPNGINLTRFLE